MPPLPSKSPKKRLESAGEASGSSSNDNTIPDSSSDTRLGLATTWFICKGPGYSVSPVSYPRILALPEMTERVHLDVHSTATATTVQNVLSLQNELGPWGEGDFHVMWDAKSANTARLLVEACGKDPETTTAKEMDELDARFTCAVCSLPTRFSFPFAFLDDDVEEDWVDWEEPEGTSIAESGENKGQGKDKGKGKEKEPLAQRALSIRVFTWRRAVSIKWVVFSHC